MLTPPEVSDAPELYDRIETTARDLPLWRHLAASADGPVLELGCGTGRVTWPLAAAGVDITGVDRAPAMLDRARAKRPPGVTARFALGDLRSLDLGRRFALVIAPARVLEHVAGDHEAEQVLRRVRAHLRPGGRVALHVARPPLPTQPERSALLVRRDRAGEVVWQERLDRARRRREVTILHRAAGRLEAYGPLRLRWFEPEELAVALVRAGLLVEPDAEVAALARRAEPELVLALARAG